ncbi:MAG: DUF4270 family protein [Dysgonomonas sp.]
MKLKLFSSFLLVLLLLFSTSCDDDLKYVGSDIQPGGDDVSLEVDTFLIKAKTISLNDSIYAWTLTGLLGKFDDSYLGSVKADYLSEFYCPDSAAFIKGYGDLTIDSVRLHVNFVRYTGDSLAPMGLSVYRVTSPLKNTFYTNINPADYCDMSDVLGQATYSINQAKRYKISSSLTVRSLIINLDNRVGEEFYDESKKRK